MKARKGIASKTLFELGMFVLAFIVIAAFATPTIQVSAENILRWLSGKGGESDLEFETTTLTEAIKCAFYRCRDGCSEAIAKTNPDYFVCEDYCKEEWQDEDGKICDENAKEYPVVVERPRGYITDEFWKNLLGDKLDRGVLENWGLHDRLDWECRETQQFGLVFPNSAECEYTESPLGALHIEKCKLDSSKTHYLWFEWHQPIFWGGYESVIICDYEPSVGIKIAPEESEGIDIHLNGPYVDSETYEIIVESDGEIIDQAFLKVEGIDTNHCADFKDHPLVTFTCTETEYSSEQICVDETLRCGKFSLTFKEYKKPEGTPAKFDIIYTDTPPTETPSEEEPTPPSKSCCSYWGSWYCVTSSDCASIGGLDWGVSCDTETECEGL